LILEEKIDTATAAGELSTPLSGIVEEAINALSQRLSNGVQN
jgi:hypothetical protein